MARAFVAGFMVAGLAFAASGALASPLNLLKNGGFEDVVKTGTQAEQRGQIDYNVALPGWTSMAGNVIGYNFVFEAYTADSYGSPGQLGYLSIWGPANPGPTSDNGLPPYSPAGGNFVGIEAGDYANAPLQQTVSGLAVGTRYELSFYSGVAQQFLYDGASSVVLNVSFGVTTQSVGPVHNASHGFSGWAAHTLGFTATSSTQVLSFLAAGTPTGVPPFVVLDAISVTEVPEPASLGLVAAGLIAAGFLLRRRRR
jgi:hypothetical protein